MDPDQLPLTIKPGEIRFHQASPPPLPPGDYTLTVNQQLPGQTDAQGKPVSYATTAPFTVSGPRFYLKPSEVYSVYPPPGQFGPFDNALPHIVFTRRTLPWERNIDGANQKQNPDAPIPWLALLLLCPDDFPNGKIPDVTARTVNALLKPETGIQGPVDLNEEGGESGNDLCNTIDIPAPLFGEIAPAHEDLPFLAHVREVNTGGKETLSLKQDGWFTVVLGNRLPATTLKTEGVTNLVCLVSLEGFGSLLPTVDASGGATVPLPANVVVRLAVLASWTFTCWGENDFKTRMADLKDNSLLVLDSAALTADDESTRAVGNAFRLGYAGLNHTVRLGEKTVSWYRGPLVPMQMDPRSPYAFIPCADRALRYDFNTGLFSAEYAAAYEMGRMMALQNRGFAAAMYRYRNRVSQEIAAEARRAALEIQIGMPADARGSYGPKDSTTQYAPYVTKESLDGAVTKMLAGGTFS